jgi:hypothetical protein
LKKGPAQTHGRTDPGIDMSRRLIFERIARLEQTVGSRLQAQTHAEKKAMSEET